MSERRYDPRRAARPGAARPAARRGGPLSTPERRWRIIKGALLLALVVYAALIVNANAARDVDFSVIRRRVAAAPGLEELHTLDENALQERLGAAPEGCAGWLMYGADEVMNVDELLVAKGPAAALDALEAAALEHVAAQLDVFRSYGVDQKGLLEDARILRRGNYLFYAVGSAADGWEDAFLSAIR